MARGQVPGPLPLPLARVPNVAILIAIIKLQASCMRLLWVSLPSGRWVHWTSGVWQFDSSDAEQWQVSCLVKSATAKRIYYVRQ